MLSRLCLLSALLFTASSSFGQTAEPPVVPGEGGPWGILWGFVFVVVTLATFALVTQGLGALFSSRDKARAARRRAADAAETPPRTHPPAPPEPKPEMEGPDARILAIIAAAIHVTLHEPVRIVSVSEVNRGGWAAEGRRQIFGSHRVR